jgi:AsmA protein
MGRYRRQSVAHAERVDRLLRAQPGNLCLTAPEGNEASPKNMRWIIRIAVFVALVVVLGLGALVAVPTERVAALVADRLSAATGREVTMTGELRPTLFPSLGVRVGDVRIGNPDWVDDGPMIAAERLDVSVEWAPLLRGEVRLDRAEFVSPRITLVRAADGRVSWDFGDAGAPDADAAAPVSDASGGPASGPFLIGFDRAAISGGEVRWIDQTTGRTITVTGLEAVLSLPTANSRATVEASADVDGRNLQVEMSVEGVAPLLSGQVRPLTAQLAWTGGQASFDGVLSLSPALDGTIDLDATDLSPLLALAGATMPDLPQGAGRDRIAAGGHVTLTDAGSVHLRDGTLSLDDNDLLLALDMQPGEERPTLRGTVSGGTVTLGSGAGAAASGAGGTGTGQSGGWSTDPIDVSGLFAADAELALRLGGVRLDTAQLGAVEVNATLNTGRVVFEIGRIDAYGGRLAGQFVVNGRGGLSVGGDMILTEVELAPLLADITGYDRLEGTGNASLQFLGVGNDLATIMSGLQGQGDFAFGAGAILGFDLAGMIRNFDTSFRGEGARTVYDSVTANFTIENGVLRNDDLLLDASWGSVEGTGSVNLGARRVDYRVIPGVMRDESGETGISVPILITGPWSDLAFRPDLEFLAEQEFLEQRDRLAAEAEARLAEEQDRLEEGLRDRANDLLGTDIQAGDGRDEIQDALEDRLSEETQNVLSRILGGSNGEATVEASE